MHIFLIYPLSNLHLLHISNDLQFYMQGKDRFWSFSWLQPIYKVAQRLSLTCWKAGFVLPIIHLIYHFVTIHLVVFYSLVKTILCFPSLYNTILFTLYRFVLLIEKGIKCISWSCDICLSYYYYYGCG